MLEECPRCHNTYKSDDDLYCRNCGARRIIENHCTECGFLCDIEDLFCPKCGKQTETNEARLI